jgi:hypothetical protein
MDDIGASISAGAFAGFLVFIGYLLGAGTGHYEDKQCKRNNNVYACERVYVPVAQTEETP